MCQAAADMRPVCLHSDTVGVLTGWMLINLLGCATMKRRFKNFQVLSGGCGDPER